MADFFEENKDEAEEQPEVKEEVKEEVEKIKLGEDEYTQEELKKYVDLGKIGVEAEEKYNTSIDKVWPEFGRKSNELKETQTKLEELQKSLEQKAEPENKDVEVAKQDAREAAKKLGISLDDDFDKKLEGAFRKHYLQEREAEKLIEGATKLEKEIDGTDGRPKFEPEKVLTFMSQNAGFKDLNKAYEAMNPNEMAEWRANKILEGKKKGIITQESTPSNKQPESVRITQDNLQSLISEVINQ